VAPPARFFLVLAGMVALYLAAVEMAKRWFYRRMTGERAPSESLAAV
jgi:hypothetical protein